MLMTMESDIQQNLENHDAYEMLQKQEEGKSVSSYVLKMKGYIDNLERLGHPVSIGLARVIELHAMLKLHEQTLPKNNAPALHAIRAGLRASRKLKPDALSLYVGNGQYAEVEAIGSYHLSLPSGLVIVLNNYHYTPSITRGIISVSRFSIYALSNKRSKSNLDSALLWHCRLGHISKKRIEKLQHDGLLDSTDLKAFEKCASLLVYQKEVENQLGKTIKSLRSDRGGEYISQEFLDHLKDHRIISHRTPPYTLQHNGVSERRNKTLLDMVRSMMSQTTLPKSFWDYTLETAARILNMVPTKKVEKTPYEVWHGQVPKLSYLKV
ncbi:zinc finger, CCHC-type containing protein [Tanacetum coccineum]